jgi:glycosyltransferase involved in cell wall biosynthesis
VKLSIYAICKNEEAAVDGFMESIKNELLPQDEIVIVDTGSTDATVTNFKRHGIIPHQATITPWRFDRARNVALALVAADSDACWSLDIDERPQAGWRALIEEHWKPTYTRLRYQYVWSWNEDGSPGLIYYGDKLHARRDCAWHLPAHEYLRFDHRPEEHGWVDDLIVHHLSDVQKPRPNLLPLLELGTREEPENDRNQHYYARELFFNGRMIEASEAFQRHLANPNATWRHERSESMMYLARVGGNKAWERMWFMRAAAECPERRETWMRWAEFEYGEENKDFAFSLAKQAQDLPEDKFYLSDPKYRGDAPTKFMQVITGEYYRTLLE